MKRVIYGLLLVMVLSSFVMATGSEISANFAIGARLNVDNYVPGGFWNNYGGYMALALTALFIGYFIFRIKSKEIPRKRLLKKTPRKKTKKGIKKKTKKGIKKKSKKRI